MRFGDVGSIIDSSDVRLAGQGELCEEISDERTGRIPHGTYRDVKDIHMNKS